LERVDLIAIVVVTTTYALTRFATFGNSRYLMPLTALLLLPFFAALIRLHVSAAARRLILAVFAVALVVSNVRTVDPVSRLVYGTFPVGGNRMLRMTRITHECCGAGRDQLVYSLEFTALADLTSDAMAARSVDESTLIVTPDSTAWNAIGRLDAETRTRTLRVASTFLPRELEYDSLLALPVSFRRAVFVGFPYASVDVALRGLRATYDVADRRRVGRGGYWMDTYEVRERAPRP
jgi:hypothetical protein